MADKKKAAEKKTAKKSLKKKAKGLFKKSAKKETKKDTEKPSVKKAAKKAETRTKALPAKPTVNKDLVRPKPAPKKSVQQLLKDELNIRSYSPEEVFIVEYWAELALVETISKEKALNKCRAALSLRDPKGVKTIFDGVFIRFWEEGLDRKKRTLVDPEIRKIAQARGLTMPKLTKANYNKPVAVDFLRFIDSDRAQEYLDSF